ncbi:MAG: hypothetical protein GXY32_05010 [Ruminococcaceae bacterium]|nr:hypothetical protein [Oscillospiraceae bacterium]
MDKDAPTVPPGIGPKLPGPPPLQPQKTLSKREIIIIAIGGAAIVVLAVLFILFAVGAARTPVQTVNQQAGELFAVQEEIAQVGLPGAGERSVMFYISDDALACALLERSAAGYRLVDASGHLPLSSSNKPGIWMASGLKSELKEFFVFGMIYDKTLHTVEVDGQPATVIDNGTYRCWFYYGASVTSINSESVVYK